MNLASGIDHGVLLVGYGVHTTRFLKRTQPYWIIKNSWGPSWGRLKYRILHKNMKFTFELSGSHYFGDFLAAFRIKKHPNFKSLCSFLVLTKPLDSEMCPITIFFDFLHIFYARYCMKC